MKTLGIIAGMGPETSAEFYLKIIGKFRKVDKINYPKILMYSVPVPFSLEQGIIQNKKDEKEFLPLLTEAIRILSKESDFIVIPCNTVHILLEDLRKYSRVPLLSITEEVKKVVGNKKVGLLASSKTVKSGIYNSLNLVLPDKQEEIARVICRLLNNKKEEKDRKFLVDLIKDFKKKGCEAVLLGCTDFQLLISSKDSALPLIDSLDILTDACVKKLVQ